MRFNLKNRPKVDLEDIDPHFQWDVKEWFEGFEKELRRRKGLILYQRNSLAWKLVKEILGDS